INLAMVGAMWFGANRIDSGVLPVGNLTAFLAYIMQILMSVMMSMMMFTMIPRAAASVERIGEVLELESSIRPPVDARVPEGEVSSIEFRDVEFIYPGAQTPVLSGITFSAHAGQTTAIIGSTGSGKSTLINLIPRLYDVSGGKVLVENIDVRDWPETELREKIGFVSQQAFLFSGTVGENLRYGKDDAKEAELWHALATAQGEQFVKDMAGGLEAPVAQAGTNLSGGQKQRLAIARALVKKPKIYIFDDSFSALDFRTDAALRAALAQEVEDAVVIIVAQRVSTIMHAHQIIVLEDGRIAGIGKHKELLETCDVYSEIVFSQLPEEEAV
ncbi:MAG: ABC transporter ATP-binding protein, partial [Firmicutes bacterium]|nr:ABC transporter ATP-binding protein [Bacillota bacterium]